VPDAQNHAEIIEIDVVDEPGFCKTRPRFELLPPLVDAILRPSPSIDSFRARVLFRALAGKDVGARFAFILLEVGIQRATCFIHQIDCSFLATLVPDSYPPSLSGHMCLIEQQPGYNAHTAPGLIAEGKNGLAAQIGLPFHQVTDHVALVFRELTRSKQCLCGDRNATYWIAFQKLLVFL
jgi:hypothetical protein